MRGIDFLDEVTDEMGVGMGDPMLTVYIFTGLNYIKGEAAIDKGDKVGGSKRDFIIYKYADDERRFTRWLGRL